jgi:hypothetical protein
MIIYKPQYAVVLDDHLYSLVCMAEYVVRLGECDTECYTECDTECDTECYTECDTECDTQCDTESLSAMKDETCLLD